MKFLPSKKCCFVGLLVLFSLRFVLWFDRKQDHPIEGVWRSVYHCDCMCESYNFFLFADGQITRFSDKHRTDASAGRYQALGDGWFEVMLPTERNPDRKWRVHPRRRSWIAPDDMKESWFRRTARGFYRPFSDTRALELVATAEERDRQFEPD